MSLKVKTLNYIAYVYVFRLGLNGDHFTNRSSFGPGSYIPVQAMCDVQNPFILRMTQPQHTTMSGMEI